MAWEWVSPVALATAGLAGGGIGAFFTWLAAKQARDDAKAIAREARDQQRLANAYVELLEVSELTGQWAQTALTPLGAGPSWQASDSPTVREQAHTEALVKAFGSAEVRELMGKWRSTVKEMLATIGLIPEVEADPWRYQGVPDLRQKLEALRSQERESREALGDQVAVELLAQEAREHDGPRA